MKTIKTSLLAAGVGLFGLLGTAGAALPYGYDAGSARFAAGCDTPGPSVYHGRAGGLTGRGQPSLPSVDRRSYGAASLSSYGSRPRVSSHTVGYGAGGGRDACDGGPTPRVSWSPAATRRYQERYDGSPLFEPWRPAATSYDVGRHRW